MDRGQEIRELKLGSSFTNPNARTMYHTLKYDFKPASVDVHKEATLETGSNSQVTVTVPHLDGSGVPNTIFKGNTRDYTKKECVLIINKETNEITLERLRSNVQVKKTRTDSAKQQPPAIITSKIENQTARQSSKTRVSTGTVRKNGILNYVPKHSPLQGSPSYPHRSPQQAAQWNASTSTLPSITSLLDDNVANNQPSPMFSNNNNNNKNNNKCNISNNISASFNTSSMLPKASVSAIQPLQQQQQQLHPSLQTAADDIGMLSSSSSSDSNDDSDSDSDDSADSMDNKHPMSNNNINSNANIANHNSNLGLTLKAPISMSSHLDNTTKSVTKDLLTKDLCLSDSNSDSDDF